MKAVPGIWRTTWRLALCVFLLAWVFHVIFLDEGQRHWESRGGSWETLSRTERWEVAWSQGPQELWRTLQLVAPAAFGWSLAFMGMTILLGMLRWRMVLRVQGIPLSLGRTAEISLVAHFANSFLLGSTGGDLLKAYYAARETHHRKTEAVITVLVDRVLGLFAMLVFATLMMLPNLALLTGNRRLTILAGVILLMLAGCSTVLALAFKGGISRRWPQVRERLKRLPWGELLDRALGATRRFGHERGFMVRVLAYSTALNFFCVLQILALADGLGIEVPPLPFLVLVPMIVCLSALPITPSGLGVRENLYVLTLSVPSLGVDPTLALSLSLLAYAGSLVWSLIGGIVYVASKERHHLPEIDEAGALPDEVEERES